MTRFNKGRTGTASMTALAVITTVMLATALFAGCASPRDVRKEFEPYELSSGGQHRIYVATEATEWKHDVIRHVAEALGGDYSLTVENLQSLSEIDLDDWDAVVVFTAFYAFGLQSDSAEFLENVDQPGKVVLVVTSNISDLDDYGVDAVSAASTGDVEEDARRLTPTREPEDVAREVVDLVRSRVP